MIESNAVLYEWRNPAALIVAELIVWVKHDSTHLCGCTPKK